MKELTAKKAFTMTGFALLAGTAAETAFYFAMAPFATKENFSRIMERFGPSLMLMLTYIPKIMFLLVFWLVMRLLPKDRWEGEKQSFSSLVGIFLMMYFVSSILNYIGIGISTLAGTGGGNGSMDVMEQMVTSRVPMGILIPVLLGPITEELIFRKIMLDRLHRYGERTAVLFSAITFGLFHQNITQLLFAGGVGFFLAYVYCKTRKVWITMLMHILINSLSTGIMLLLPMLENDSTETTVMLLLALFMIFVLMVLGLIALIRAVRKRSLHFDDTMPESIPTGSVARTVWLNPSVLLFVILCSAAILMDLFHINPWE